MQKSTLKGSIVLIFSGILCKMLGAFFRLPLTNILGTKGIGVFQMIMALYSFALILCSGGVTITLSKLIAQAKSKNNKIRIRSLYKVSIAFSLLIGLFFGFIFFLFAKGIAFLQGEVLSENGYRLLLVLLPLGGIIASLRGIIQGHENMFPTAISQIIEQSFRFVFGLMLSYFLCPFGIEFGVFGAILGIVLGEVFACFYLFLKARKLTQKVEGSDSKGFFKTLIPIMLAMAVLPLVNAVDSFLIVKRLFVAGFDKSTAVELFGLQTGVVGAILNLPLIISTSIAVAILPSISYLNEEEFSKKITQAFKVLWIVILPMVLGIVAIAKPLYMLIYPMLDTSMLEYAVNLTRLGAISTILTALMQYFITILQAKGNLFYLLGLQVFAGGIKVVIVILLCARQEINIYGLAIANIFLASIVCIGCLIKLKSSLSLSYFDLFVPIVSSVIMMFAASQLSEILNISLALKILLSAVCGVFVYFALCLPCIFQALKDLKLVRKRKEA